MAKSKVPKKTKGKLLSTKDAGLTKSVRVMAKKVAKGVEHKAIIKVRVECFVSFHNSMEYTARCEELVRTLSKYGTASIDQDEESGSDPESLELDLDDEEDAEVESESGNLFDELPYEDRE